MKRELNPKMLYFGTPIVLVSSLNTDGSTNIAPMSSAWWVGQTAMLGLSVNSQTVRNLQQRPRLVLNLVDASMVDAVDRLALLTGRPDVPDYKRARGYTHEPDKYRAAGLTPTMFDAGSPTGVAESLIQLEGQVRAIHDIDEDDSGLRAIEARIVRTHVDEALLMDGHPNYIDPLRWHPLIMKFTEYFAGGELARPSSLAKGWEMPALPAAAPAGA
ncbi:MAG TPA: flavin reductase family protein [Mycobacteriales bacterium]|nr:flavin reductase family protein [Mycobacteriales bacterium]